MKVIEKVGVYLIKEAFVEGKKKKGKMTALLVQKPFMDDAFLLIKKVNYPMGVKDAREKALDRARAIIKNHKRMTV
jgi:hypothetical protein